MLQLLEKPRIIEFPRASDDRGSLYFVEANRHVPFEIQRIYYINDVPNGESRGSHAHKSLFQVLIVLNGSLEVELDDGEAKMNYNMSRANEGLFLPPGYWRGLKNFASGSVLMALTNSYYDPNDYIRDYAEYLNWRKNESPSRLEASIV